KKKWPQARDVIQMSALVRRENTPKRAQVQFLKDWHLKGHGFVCCSCDVPCPCRSNARPTYGRCENTGAYHVRQGHYGSTNLDGVTFVTTDGCCMLMEASPTALYVNQSVTDEQVLALERLFQSFDFLHPFMFLRVRRSSISFTDTPEAIYEVMVPGALKMKIQRQLDGRGDPLFPTAALDHFSNTIEYAHNLIYKSWDQEG